MGEIEAYNDLVPTSNEWLRRYQVPTDRVIDRTSLELIKIFVDTIDPNMERLPGLGDEPLDEANKFLTVELESIGIKLGKNPAREKDRAEGITKIHNEKSLCYVHLSKRRKESISRNASIKVFGDNVRR